MTTKVKYSIPLIVKQAGWWNDGAVDYLKPTPQVAQKAADDFNSENVAQYSDLPYLKKLTAEAQGVKLIVTAEIDGDATPERVIDIQEELTGQCSDGWGEGFAQQEFSGDELGYAGRKIFIATWSFERRPRVIAS